MGEKEDKDHEEAAKKALLEGMDEAASESAESDETEEVEEVKEKIIESLGTVETDEAKKQRLAQENSAKTSPSIGYMDIFPETVPSKNRFYEKNRHSSIRALRVDEIKYYSGMNEEDIFDVDEKVNTIIDSCTAIKMGNGVEGTYKDLSQTDKIFFLFAIRDYTIKHTGRENKLFQKITNPKDGTQVSIEITKDVFEYYDIPKGIEKWYSDSDRCFVVTDESIGVKPLKVYIPTIGVIEWIAKYIRTKEEAKQRGEDAYYDKVFLTYLQFLVPDWRLLENKGEDYMKELKSDYDNWNEERHFAMVHLSQNINYGINPSVSHNFGGAIGEVSVPINFRSYKSLFDFSDIATKLFSDTE